jgi:hypothetical protein
LQVRYTIRATRDATALDWYYIQFNSDSGTNYNSHYLLGNGSSASSGQEYTSYPNGIVSTAPAVNSTGFKGAVLDVLDPFETTKFTTTRMLGGYNGGAVNRVTLTSGLWRNTAAVSAITIVPVNSELAANSRFSLYGIKGA